MGISFSNLVENSRTVAVDFGGGNLLTVTYKPTAMSPAHLQKIQGELDKGDDTDPYAVAHMFCSIVTNWNLEGPLGEDKDGAPIIAEGAVVPMDVDHVAWLPSSVIQFIVEQVAEDSAPKGKKAKR
jgi:hypothetical protein